MKDFWCWVRNNRKWYTWLAISLTGLGILIGIILRMIQAVIESGFALEAFIIGIIFGWLSNTIFDVAKLIFKNARKEYEEQDLVGSGRTGAAKLIIKKAKTYKKDDLIEAKGKIMCLHCFRWFDYKYFFTKRELLKQLGEWVKKKETERK